MSNRAILRKIRPRAYQAEAVQSIYTYFETERGNPLILMPTGTGKAVVIALFLESVLKVFVTQKIMVLTHVKELVDQNHKKFLDVWPTAPAGIYSAGLNKRQTNQSVIFAGIGSVAKRAKEFGKVDLIIIDEAHLVSQNDETMYRQFLNDLLTINPNLKVIGLTATGWRLGQGHITDDGIFTDVCFDITGLHAFNRLISEGYLSPLVPRKTELLLDMEGVHMRGGDFIASELQLAVDKNEITYSAIKETIELGHDRQHWLIFASGIEHALNIAAMLESMGVPTVVIHSKMSKADRDQGILDFMSGKYRAAVNNNILTTGFDFPEIDLIVVLRPTGSPVLWVQMLGRGTRPVYCTYDEQGNLLGFDLDTIEGRLAAIEAGPKQNCLVLDFAGNTKRLGPINDPVIPRKKGQKGGDAPVKLCENCNTYNHASVTHCVFCGAEFLFKVKLKQNASYDALIKTDLPIVEIFTVDHITYSKHEKLSRPPTLKVTYYCKLRMFTEYIGVEAEPFIRRKAAQWWKERTRNNAGILPVTTAEALQVAEHLIPVTHIRVWVNKKYPEILNHCFDGTAFGTHEAIYKIPTVGSLISKPTVTPIEDFEDDIPF